MSVLLNGRAWDLVDDILASAATLGVVVHDLDCGAKVVDFGVETTGSLQAGIRLAKVCMAGLAEVRLTSSTINGVGWPSVFIETDSPVEACLYSQYAGWQIQYDDYFAMGSGPMRARAATEELFHTLGYREDFYCSVGVLESSRLPDSSVVCKIAEKIGIEPRNLILLVAPTSSLAGNLQIVARSVETCLHKLYEVGFDVKRIVSAVGWAPLSPVAANDMEGIGRTNDAILYGGRVTLLVTGDDESILEIGDKVPSCSSPMYGRPFMEIFEEAGRDFYQIDPLIFSPAEVLFQNIETGGVFHYGGVSEKVLLDSFGVEVDTSSPAIQ